MKTALYPGSFDPVTNGHLDIVTRAAALFDRVIVGVYDAPAKEVLFSTQERVEMFSRAVQGLPNVSVASYSGLTVDFARRVGAQALVRGLRAVTDFEYEFQMALLNRKMAPEIEVVCLMTSLDYSFLTASMVKEIAGLGGRINGLAPDHVVVALEEKFRQRSAKIPTPRNLVP